MKLFFTDSKKVQTLVAEGDTFNDLIAPMIEHQRSRFIYSAGTIIPPGKLDKGSSYCVYANRNGCYTVEA